MTTCYPSVCLIWMYGYILMDSDIEGRLGVVVFLHTTHSRSPPSFSRFISRQMTSVSFFTIHYSFYLSFIAFAFALSSLNFLNHICSKSPRVNSAVILTVFRQATEYVKIKAEWPITCRYICSDFFLFLNCMLYT